MQAKLTLSIEESVMKKAKEFAKKNNTSLSQMIEDYFSSVLQKETSTDANTISPTVKRLLGILNLSPDFDLKKDRKNYIQKKYK